MSTWEDPFHPDVPIDVDRTAVAVMLAVTMAVEQDGYALTNKQKAAIIDRVRELLTAYDKLRSEHIDYLRNEVVRLHNCIPSSTFVSVRNPDNR